MPGLGPAYTPPHLGQDNPGSSTRYMPLIIKKVRGAAGREKRKDGEGEKDLGGHEKERIAKYMCVYIHIEA